MKIKFLKAFNGDCIWLSYSDSEGVPRNVLIDGGIGNTYTMKGKKKLQNNELFEAIFQIRSTNQKIDLLILTHVDDDHIGGVLKWFKNDTSALDLIEKIWFNSGRLIKEFYETEVEAEYDNSLELKISKSTNTSIKQGGKFEDFIESKTGLWDRRIIKAGDAFNYLDLTFKILSPDDEKLKLLLGKWEKEEPITPKTSKTNDYHLTLQDHVNLDSNFIEDSAVHNGSSIAFILGFGAMNYLFLGDAHPSVVTSSLREFGFNEDKPLQCEIVKISHHGSKSNTHGELLGIIDSRKYFISTNGDKHSHPDKRFLARLIANKPICEIYFNYPERIDKIFQEIDYAQYPNFKALAFSNNHYDSDEC